MSGPYGRPGVAHVQSAFLSTRFNAAALQADIVNIYHLQLESSLCPRYEGNNSDARRTAWLVFARVKTRKHGGSVSR